METILLSNASSQDNTLVISWLNSALVLEFEEAVDLSFYG